MYLGPNLPKYVLRNLKYLQSTFLEHDIYFISDSLRSLKKAKKTGVKIWLAPNPEETWKDVLGNLEHQMSFRNGFWFKTLARIFVLDSFLQNHPDKPCLQIEADVFLFPTFPVSQFDRLNAEIAFPMESKERGIASLLFLKSHVASRKLSELATEAVERNGQITDMSLLGQVAHSERMRFMPLQTLPDYLWGTLNQPEARSLVCKKTLDSEGVFDGISVGQYLLGIDARNSRGTRIVYQQQPSHAINPDKLLLEMDSEGNVVIAGPTGNSVVYNLHNHAKDLRLYSKASRKKLLQKRITSRKSGELRELVFSAVVLAVFKACERRVKFVFHAK